MTARTGDTDVTITLQANGGVRGRIVFADGRSPAMFTIAGFGTQTPFSNPEGSFELQDLPPGDYRLRASGPEFLPKRLDSVTVEPDKTADLGEIEVAAGRSASGRVQTSDGAPVPGATVMAGRRLMGDGATARGGRRGGKQATAEEDGTFFLRGLGEEDLSILAEHKTLGRSPAKALPGGNEPVTDLVLTLAAPGALEGTASSAGKPAARASIVVRSKTSSGTVFQVRTGADGAFRFDRLAPDTYVVTALAGRAWRRTGDANLVGKEIAIASGETKRIALEVQEPVASDDSPRAGDGTRDRAGDGAATGDEDTAGSSGNPRRP